MTDDKAALDLDAIMKRAAAATPGPWAARPCPPCTDRGRLDVVIWDPSENIPVATWADSDSYREEDARFIAHAREDVPALLNALAAERDRADRAEARLADVNATVDKFAGRKYDAEVQPHGDPEYWRGAEHAQDYIVHRLRTALGNAEATA